MTTLKNRKWYSYRLSKRITRVAKVWHAPLSLVEITEQGEFKLLAVAESFVTGPQGVGVSKTVARLTQHVPAYRLLAYCARLTEANVAQLQQNVGDATHVNHWIESYNSTSSGEDNGD